MNLSRLMFPALPAALGLFSALLPLGCGEATVTVTSIKPDAGMDGGEDAGADANGDDSGADCAGQCLARGGLGWEKEPFLVWMGGSEFDAPPCPDGAGEWEGRADLMAPNICPICTCGDPSCVLPAGLTASTSPTCPDNAPPGATLTPFDAPAGWSGACVSPGVIPSSLLASISIAPVTVSACTPKGDPVPGVTGGPVSWGRFARACQLGLSLCKGQDSVCAPPSPEGFRYCIAKDLGPGETEPECSASYPDKFVFYGGIEDTRTCSACACEPPVGADCSAYVTASSDANCTVPLDSATITLAGPVCHNIAPGMNIKSMSAQWLTNNPGSCTPSGGEPSGAAVPTDPTVFCCQAPPM